jgi:7,8-dihydroneopterin aldolase/epimerase/oxygenase
VRAKWTIRIDGLKTQLAVGMSEKERRPQVMLISLVINGMTPDAPGDLADCLDYAAICDWIIHQWPKSAHTPLLETRVNELLVFLFEFDKRVQDAWVGVYKTIQPRGSTRVGVERQVSRSQFQARLRVVRG